MVTTVRSRGASSRGRGSSSFGPGAMGLIWNSALMLIWISAQPQTPFSRLIAWWLPSGTTSTTRHPSAWHWSASRTVAEVSHSSRGTLRCGRCAMKATQLPTLARVLARLRAIHGLSALQQNRQLRSSRDRLWYATSSITSANRRTSWRIPCERQAFCSIQLSRADGRSIHLRGLGQVLEATTDRTGSC